MICKDCEWINSNSLAGCAMTTKPCQLCKKLCTYGSTATDLLCEDCAKENNLCQQCGKPLDKNSKSWCNTHTR